MIFISLIKNNTRNIEKNIELIDEDKNLFVAGFEKSIEDLIDPREISKRVMGKKIYQLSSKEQIDMFNFKFRNTLFQLPKAPNRGGPKLC